ncbi:hypothetical protein FQ087_11360 [Sporosarcina sp. ANT_H38]|uniref:hypothetical protein n=1 Tax=Sporosarcina sp. ANT_H38 TaxID=2597358 RepID=UPI0011F2CDA2|nr:hypothetical protein [Sporosarcina sp. ANT_H38]KAA0966787.1 hypothetical protein FQ087_11360 [Sporosarcina sp. ANT_H38]
MELIFHEQHVEFDKTPSQDEVIAKINELLKGNYYFSHFIADGTEVYEDHEDYLTLNVDRIEKLEVIAKTEKEFLNDVLLSAEDYLKRAKPELVSLPEGFYSNPTSEIRSSFSQLMDGLQWLDEMLEVVNKSNERPEDWNTCMELSKSMKTEIVNLSEAVDNSDNILIADIIQYEFIPLFESLETDIGKTIDTVGTRHDLS